MSPRSSAVRHQETAPVFAALGDGTRLRLVTRLSGEGPLSIARLTEGARVTRQAITKHLRALEGAGVVRGTRRGRERIWELRTKRLELASRYLDEVSGQWDAAIERLRAHLGEQPDAESASASASRSPVAWRKKGDCSGGYPA